MLEFAGSRLADLTTLPAHAFSGTVTSCSFPRYELAQASSPTVLQGLMREVGLLHAAQVGFELSATMRIDHCDAGSAEPANTFSETLEGAITAATILIR